MYNRTSNRKRTIQPLKGDVWDCSLTNLFYINYFLQICLAVLVLLLKLVAMYSTMTAFHLSSHGKGVQECSLLLSVSEAAMFAGPQLSELHLASQISEGCFTHVTAVLMGL